jgi:hypothetical protein
MNWEKYWQPPIADDLEILPSDFPSNGIGTIMFSRKLSPIISPPETNGRDKILPAFSICNPG